LDDNKTINDYGIKENDILIITGVKQKQKDTLDEKSPKKDKKEMAVEYMNEHNILKGMGYDNIELITASLNLAKGDINLAIEYINGGFSLRSDTYNDQENPNNNSQEENKNAENQFDFSLQNIASIVKVLNKKNPDQTEKFLQSIQENDPEIITLIEENEEEFRTLISSKVNQGDIDVYNNFLRSQGIDTENNINNVINTEENNNSNEENKENLDINSNANNNNSIKLNKEEYEAVKRLQALGFSEIESCQAFFCF